MHGGAYSKMKCDNFWEKYTSEISPKLEEIDIYMRSGTDYYDADEVSRLLYIPKEEVKSIMEKENLKRLDKNTFFVIMKKGSSKLCTMFSRELSLGIPSSYTPDDISYIYDLDIEKVLKACKRIGKSSFTVCAPRELFLNIEI